MTAIAKPTAQENVWDPRTVLSRERDADKLAAKAFVGLPDKASYVRRWKTLKEIRRPMERVYRDVRDFIVPALGRYLSDDGSDPDDNEYRVCHSKIFDSSPTKMALTAADGLHGGLTNQSEQWFSYYAGDYKDYENSFSSEAKSYITNAQDCTRDTLGISNFYSAIYQFYLEVMCFGTALMLILSDPVTRARFYTKTVGTYWLSQDSSQRIDSVYIRASARAEDIVKEYGRESCPDRVIRAMEQGRQDQRFNVIQCIQPWNFFGRDKPHPDYRYEDIRFVEGGSDDEKILFRGGYRTKPFVAMRWADAGDAVYSRSCPGMDALPDVKQLQAMTLDANMATKWLSNPAWVNSSEEEIKDIIPGGIYHVKGDPRAAMLQPIVPPQFNLQANAEMAQMLRERISAVFYNREILLVQSRQRQITATEVNQLIAEKNAVLGPIVARTGDNALIPILDRVFEIIALEWRIIQDPPEEIQGLEIKPYFTGQLARAQRQGGTLQQIDYTLQIVERLTAMQSPDVAYFDLGRMFVAADETDVFLHGTVRTPQEVEEIKSMQQQAMQQQQQAMQMQQMLDMAKTAGDTSTDPSTLLGRIAGGEEGEPA